MQHARSRQVLRKVPPKLIGSRSHEGLAGTPKDTGRGFEGAASGGLGGVSYPGENLLRTWGLNRSRLGRGERRGRAGMGKEAGLSRSERRGPHSQSPPHTVTSSAPRPCSSVCTTSPLYCFQKPSERPRRFPVLTCGPRPYLNTCGTSR